MNRKFLKSLLFVFLSVVGFSVFFFAPNTILGANKHQDNKQHEDNRQKTKLGVPFLSQIDSPLPTNQVSPTPSVGRQKKNNGKSVDKLTPSSRPSIAPPALIISAAPSPTPTLVSPTAQVTSAPVQQPIIARGYQLIKSPVQFLFKENPQQYYYDHFISSQSARFLKVVSVFLIFYGILVLNIQKLRYLNFIRLRSRQ